MNASNTMTIGMDVSDKNCHMVVLDGSGAVVMQAKTATSEAALRRWFGRYPGAVVALEVGPHSPWMSRLLSELGMQIIVANPRKVALIHSSESKNDRLDAERLARLARLDPQLLGPVQHRRAETQASLTMLRARAAMVRSRTLLINAVRGLAKAYGVMLPKGSSKVFHDKLSALPDELADVLRPMMAGIAALSVQIAHYDQVIEDLAREVYPETEPLQTIDGVGALTALCYVLTIEDPERFKSSRAVGSYLGLRPRQDQSGDVDKQLKITKAGDKAMRHLLVQSAQRILGPHGKDSDLRRWGLKIAATGGKAAKKRAVIAVARKLAVLMHRLWTTGQVYEPLHHSNQTAAAAAA